MFKAKKKDKKAEAKIEPKQVHYDVIRRPVITEKATTASEQGKVIFKVASDASKAQIKEAVEVLFKVTVVKVNTLNVHGKSKVFRGTSGVRGGYKKAVVTLAKGQSIDLAGGVA